jgi:hypothetical protein
MDLVGIIALWGVVAGLVIGLAIVSFAPADFRAKAEGQLLRFGSGGTLFMLVWSAVSDGRASAHVEIGIGVIVFASLVAGVVLMIARKARAGI